MVRDARSSPGSRPDRRRVRAVRASPTRSRRNREQYLRARRRPPAGDPRRSILAIADKLDHVVGAFVAGKIPSGSEDPFAGAAANGILRNLVEADRHVSLETLLARALELFQPFSRARCRRGKGTSPTSSRSGSTSSSPIAASATTWRRHVAGSLDDPTDVRHRAEALAAYSTSPDFAPLVVGYKRVANILAVRRRYCARHPAPRSATLTEPAEARPTTRPRHAGGSPTTGRRAASRTALAELLALRAPIDRFFDDVMVMG